MFLVATVVALVAIPASAQISVSPDTNVLVLREGDTFDEVLTVTVPADTATAKADIYLLADTTGSMGSILAAVRSGASDVVDGLIAALPGTDLRFGVGNYKDFPFDAYAFDHQLSISADPVAVKAQVNLWFAGGGVDGPEGQFFALERLASNVDPAGGTIGWRPDAERILVWFGDAPGHDPVCAAISSLGFDITEASLTTALQAANVHVIAISTVTGYANALDDDPTLAGGDYLGPCGTEGGTAGQATRLSTATGGDYESGIDSGTIVSTIVDLVTAQVTTIDSLRLVAAGATAPFVTTIDPSGGYGPIDTATTTEWTFDVSFAGTAPCGAETQVFEGTIDVVADGSIEDQKSVRITVPACDTACIDRDGDGYGDPGDPECPMGDTPDCDDSRPDVNPGAAEKCSLVDENCNGENNEGFPPDCLAVDLDALSAEVRKDGVMLRWRTFTESDNYGFRLLRSTNGGLTTETVGGFIAARGSELAGADYEYLDVVGRMSGTVSYWLEDIDLDGTVTSHGPVTVTLRPFVRERTGEDGRFDIWREPRRPRD